MNVFLLKKNMIGSQNYKKSYFTITNNGTAAAKMKFTNSISFMYSTDGYTWASATEIQIGANVSVRISANLIGTRSKTISISKANTALADTPIISVSGNIMSLIYGDDFENQTNLTVDLKLLFSSMEYLIDASKLVLPATTLINYAYHGMFSGCKNLKYAPEVLPASNGSSYCYQKMFFDCANLEYTPMISLINGDAGAYQCESMFYGCKKIEQIDIYSAIEGTGRTAALDGMLVGCNNLKRVNLYADSLNTNCYSYIFGLVNPPNNITIYIHATSGAFIDTVNKYFSQWKNFTNKEYINIRLNNSQNTELTSFAEALGAQLNDCGFNNITYLTTAPIIKPPVTSV